MWRATSKNPEVGGYRSADTASLLAQLSTLACIRPPLLARTDRGPVRVKTGDHDSND